ncbi:anhydro-N-acetylmuramic acid kinase [Proteobacteria bacterium 005FR1]|nr:anhydro-N-acetylmuramic acid kinase [Proteobacteria bacterium 005FR1]
MTQRELYIGLISGTSVDCIDAVLVDFSGAQPQFLHTLAYPIPSELKSRLYDLMVPGNDEIDRLGVLDQQIGCLFADAVLAILKNSETTAEEVVAVGSHGQTVRHRPPGELEEAFTLQIGDANQIAERTGITTVGDFRRRDMAAGGQGAPLVPAFHRAVFQSTETDRIILNIGGIANLTLLPRAGEVLGFDTGPGNGLMDGWIRLHKGEDYDADGQWARAGNVHAGLLQSLLMHPYFERPAPKSTGKEMFTMAWLQSALEQFPGLNPADVQATLLELTAATISNDILALSMGRDAEIFVCGGGAYNGCLMSRLQQLLPENRITTTEALGIPPDWVEAGAFAWLARQTINGRPGNVPSVTGARREVVLGSIHQA